MREVTAQGSVGLPDLPSVSGTLGRLGDSLRFAVVEPGGFESMRLGGAVRDEDGWQAMAEADTPARSGAAVTAVGDEAVFVWGGFSSVPGESPDSDRQHADGAIWRP